MLLHVGKNGGSRNKGSAVRLAISTSLLLAKVGSGVVLVLRTIFMANLLCPQIITGVFPTQKAPRG